MKQKIAAAIVLMALTGMVSAMTNIDVILGNSGGQTNYVEYAEIKGFDWSESPAQTKTTGWTYTCIDNDEKLSLNSRLYTTGMWEMVSQQGMSGSGNTLIDKMVRVWTEDQTTEGGKYKWPTEAWIDTVFTTDYFGNTQSVYFLQDVPHSDLNSQEGPAAVFRQLIETDETFNFGADVGIGMCNNCELPDVPVCVGVYC